MIAGHKVPNSEGFFLSPTNPIATADQRDLDALCIRIFEDSRTQKARLEALSRWKLLMGTEMPAETWARFEKLMGDEWTYQCVMKAANSDANYPKVTGHLFAPAHAWFGMKVPGGRVADNPDVNYGFVPIDGYARFELHGQRFDIEDSPLQLVSNSQMTGTQALLDWADVEFEADGSFVITIDPEPANGRPNHLQSTLDTRYLFLRDCRSDWRQSPNAYRIQRLDPPAAPPMTFEQLVNRAGLIVTYDALANYFFTRKSANAAYNVITPPFNTADLGGMHSARMSQMRVKIAEDEAVIVTIGHGGARYRGMLLRDAFARTMDYWTYTSSLNGAQSVSDNAELTTFVISIQDPGIHNWLDTEGLREPRIVQRWQGFPHGSGPADEPWARSELVKLKDLDRKLPDGVRRVTPAERQQQLGERLRTYNLRFLDH